MTTQQPVGPINAPTPTPGLDQTAPRRRVLTGDGLRAIHAAAQAATSPAQLLHDCLAALDAALRAPASRASGDARGQADPPQSPSGPAGYAIPSGQWNAVFDAITGRAHVWGLAAEIGLDLALNLMPAAYDDPDHESDAVPVLADLRPGEHHLTLTRDAVATIAACQAHLRRLASHYHPASPAYRLAADSWNDLVAVLLTAHPDARVTGHGDLGLLIESTGGTAWALTYRLDTRRCTTTGCQAVIDNDATARALSPDATVLNHQHVPSYPLDGPAPGRWTATY
jgi:hypothetical protein